ncbi:hypothetical protein PYW07_008632 [Mythimna separata]|uniref:Uncharacterized protein n=1 Tax=Mythimna separata TaxID=271217 RepID=A0AAD8DN16_MYTSE|nr:hypothetical protein PYW07_008632 [Mythimna separata]
MERWASATAVVTGATGGVGGAVSVALANAGMTVIALDVNLDRIQELQCLRQDVSNGRIIAKRCDITSPEDVSETFKWVCEEFGGVHVLVNCAGVLYQGQITDVGSNTLSDNQIIKTVDVNVTGMILCTRHAVAAMKVHGIDGHIININSIAGHYIPWADNMNVYATTKHAVTAFTASLNTELAAFQHKIKTTSISPGLVSTPMADYVKHMNMPALQPSDLTDAVLYVLSTPPHVNVSHVTRVAHDTCCCNNQLNMPALQPSDLTDAVLYVLSTPPHVNVSHVTRVAHDTCCCNNQLNMPALQPSDLTDAVLYVLSTPPHVNVSHVTRVAHDTCCCNNQLNMPALQPSDLTDAVLYVLSTPPHVNVSHVTRVAHDTCCCNNQLNMPALQPSMCCPRRRTSM